MTTTYELTDLEKLEAEAVHIFREVAATIERPGLLFSGGKDSVVMLHLAVKAFWPARVPFPVMHVDTGQNFDEVIDFRDRVVDKYGLRLLVASVQDDIDAGRITEEYEGAPRNRHQTVSLLRGIKENNFGAVFGGARRDEEKARAKERVFSFRDEFGAWDPRNQRVCAIAQWATRRRPAASSRSPPLLRPWSTRSPPPA
jgi:sulfate adenylyltransferase subunit 2